jgi:sigma-B regulation protein RsbU (phosphoserine phosphatase)
MNRFSPLRFWVFLRRMKLLDRIALAILVLYGIVWLTEALGASFPLAALIGLLAFVAAVYLFFRVLPWVRRQLLWRLRNRLIIAYVFIAVVPVVLLLTMAALGAYVLYLQLGAHLLRDALDDRISMISADAADIAGAIEQRQVGKGAPPSQDSLLARPDVASLIAAARSEYPELVVLPNLGQHLAKAGDGRHYAGLAEHEGKLWIACAEYRTGSAGPVNILVAIPVTASVLDRLASSLGPIRLLLMDIAPDSAAGEFGVKFQGQNYVERQDIASEKRALAPPVNWLDKRVNGAATLEASHVDPSRGTSLAPVLASFAVRPSTLNHRLLESVGAVAPLLVTVLVIVGLVFLLIEMAALVTGVVLTRTITRAVGGLYEATLHVRRGDFTYRVPVHRRDQIGALGESFNEMTASVAELLVEQRRRQRLENELSIAREVQEQLFPRSLPELPGLELAAICRAARMVSGDYYDFIRLGPSRLGIALADISGKGISAALLMASLQAALRSQAALDGHGGPAKLVERLNQHLFRNTSDDRYATFFYGVYDAEGKTLTYTNAGHLAPFFVSDGRVQQLDHGGTVVGLFEDCVYEQTILKVEPGSVLVAFSDGLTEPENAFGEEFGMERVREEILRLQRSPTKDLADNLIAAANQWAGAAEQADDITVVVARMS